MGHYTEGRHWNDKTKAWEFDKPPEDGLSGSNDLLCDIRFKLLLEYCENVQKHLPTGARSDFNHYKRTFIDT